MSAAKKIVEEFVDGLNEKEKSLLLVWSQDAKSIVDKQDLSKKEKLAKLYDLKTSPVLRTLLTRLFKLIKQHAWDERSWSSRFALLGFAGGLGALGTQWAGVAASGGAIGLPLFLLTSAGGALLGTIIDEVKKSSNGKQ